MPSADGTPRSGPASAPAAPRVLAICLNPALDLTYEVAALHHGRCHRVDGVHIAAGGKAVNAARVLDALAVAVTLTGLCGGRTGDDLRGALAQTSIGDAFVEIAGETRRTVSVVDARGEATGLWEPGPEVAGPEWEALLARVESLLPSCEAVIASGSLPAGVPGDAYAAITRLARAAGRPIVVDADGDALRRALGAGPDVVKPNASELASVAGATGDAIAQARSLRDAGARTVVATRGADGLIAVDAERVLSARPPIAVDGNPTGAGDAAVAALARGLATGAPWPVMLGDAVALATASVMTPAAGAFAAGAYEELRRSIHVTEVDRCST